MRVLVCGGGTGGHIYPALSVVDSLRRDGLAADDFLWIGTRDQMEERLVPREGLRLETIPGGPIVGMAPEKMMINAAQLTWSLGTVNRLLGRFRPHVLFLTGGYVNVPVSIVARVRRVPAAIFLPDVEPGTAIEVLKHLVDRIACTTAASAPYLPEDKMVVTGYPVRPELRRATTLLREEALATFHLTTKRPTLLVFGGSRGARSINRALMAVLPALLAEDIQVIHVSGQLDWEEVEANAATLPADSRSRYRPYPYLHGEMGAAMRAADLAVTRAGAGMLGEAPAFALPSILVPYPHAWRYQKINADYLAERGAAVRLDDEQLGERLLPTVLSLLQDAERLAAMSAAAHALDVPDAADNVARLLLDLKRERRD
ncbi:MAG: UDP-N-acetylglucosamine--N-acetylmuramyl-(pentapeptide) pyrophosphoryl-undecaprenol N-acetylglucosamine transferase [Candidatus Promineifilaceae bacterium]|nr:UDP-N-acetylglucosamine--N-acetylmuramyl-(pentapeptide) pyrophosphoryl-undecaprenol N-acetylglucosamine transferase [Candidatus Promineifilaceae bacterium]